MRIKKCNRSMQQQNQPIQDSSGDWKNRNSNTESVAPELVPQAQSSSHHQFSCRIHEPVSRANNHRWLFCYNVPSQKNTALLTPHTGQPENLRLTVSAFLYLFELTTLLLKKINPHLRSNTILPAEDKLVIRLRFHAYTDKCIVMKFSF